MRETGQSEIGVLKKVLLKHPKDSFRSQNYIDLSWERLNYLSAPNFEDACTEYDAFIKILEDHNVQTEFLEFDESTGLDSIYVRDASIITDSGALICNMGKADRSQEPDSQMNHYLKSGRSVINRCQLPGKIEGGDVAWLDEKTIAVANGYRTNASGIQQLSETMSDLIDEVVIMDSPHYKGPSDVFHLMSVLSPVDHNLAVVYSPLMTVPFRNYLLKKGIDFIEVPDEEFESLGCNVLAIAPRLCLMVKGNPITRSRLVAAGVEVIEFAGSEICLKGSGGPTCLTRPISRMI